MGKPLRSLDVPTRRSVWTRSWSSWVSMGCGARGSFGGCSMRWVVFVTMRGCFWRWMRRTHVGFSRVMPCWGGWTGTGCWTRARTSSITCWPSLSRTFLSAVFKPWSSSPVWPSPFTMPECLSGRGILGMNKWWVFPRYAYSLCCLIVSSSFCVLHMHQFFLLHFTSY